MGTTDTPDWLDGHTEQLIADVRKRWIDRTDQHTLTQQDAEFDLLALLSAVLSQQHRIRRLQRESIAMREIVRAVAGADPLSSEARAIADVPGWAGMYVDWSYVPKARELMAQWDKPTE